MDTMRPSDLREWAKEEMADALMKAYTRLISDPVNGAPGIAERNALRLQRDRALKMFGFHLTMKGLEKR